MLHSWMSSIFACLCVRLTVIRDVGAMEQNLVAVSALLCVLFVLAVVAFFRKCTRWSLRKNELGEYFLVLLHATLSF